MNAVPHLAGVPCDSVAGLFRDGYEIVPAFVDSPNCENLIRILETGISHNHRSPNRRNVLFDIPQIMEFAISPRVVDLIASFSTSPLTPVRAILFDKTSDANWPVGWHQDQIISVAKRIEVDGFTAWSVKQGIPHVRPPVQILEQMVTLRLHLDDCGEDNGALHVLAGSHASGILDDLEIESWKNRASEKICAVRQGDVLLMRPLLLHASPSSQNAMHRRVLHIEYGPTELPGGLRWYRSN